MGTSVCGNCGAGRTVGGEQCTFCDAPYSAAEEEEAPEAPADDAADDAADDSDSSAVVTRELVRGVLERMGDIEEDEESGAVTVTLGTQNVTVFVRDDSVSVWAVGAACEDEPAAQALLERAKEMDWVRVFLGEPDEEGEQFHQVEAWLPAVGLSAGLLRRVIAEAAAATATNADEEIVEGADEDEGVPEDVDVGAVAEAAAETAGAILEADGDSDGDSFSVVMNRDGAEAAMTLFVRDDSVSVWSAVGSCSDTLDARAVLEQVRGFERTRAYVRRDDDAQPGLEAEARIPRRGLTSENLAALFVDVASAIEGLEPYVA